MADRLGVKPSSWEFRTADGRSLRVAVDFLVFFARGDKPWPYAQVQSFDPPRIAPFLVVAARRWHDERYQKLAGDLLGRVDPVDTVWSRVGSLEPVE